MCTIPTRSAFLRIVADNSGWRLRILVEEGKNSDVLVAHSTFLGTVYDDELVEFRENVGRRKTTETRDVDFNVVLRTMTIHELIITCVYLEKKKNDVF